MHGYNGVGAWKVIFLKKTLADHGLNRDLPVL
jgi:hypothetical protein